MPASAAPPACVRCRQPLPQGSQFCVACGCSNEAAVDERIVDLGNQIESRRWWFQFWNSLCAAFPIFRLFR
jgi:hypothetical protein